jgi:hypothetical protein
MTRPRACAAGVSLGLVCAVFACRQADRLPPNDREVVAPRTEPAALAPDALTMLPAVPVTGWKGPGERPFEVTLRTADPVSALARRFGTITLRTSLRARTPDLGQYPCTSCHLGRRMVLADERVADAHQNIKPIHPAQTGAACSTCHAPDNVELLALKSGERATLDHAYRLCAQCHFSQAEAWAGGGHGKRLDGWQGRRVVMGCGDCHDPHKPTLEPRIPFRAPQLQRPRGDAP